MSVNIRKRLVVLLADQALVPHAAVCVLDLDQVLSAIVHLRSHPVAVLGRPRL